MRIDSTVTQKGQVTIPVAVRRALELGPHDRVSFDLDADTGVVTLRRAPGIASVYGAVHTSGPPKPFRYERDEFERGVAEEVVSED